MHPAPSIINGRLFSVTWLPVTWNKDRSCWNTHLRNRWCLRSETFYYNWQRENQVCVGNRESRRGGKGNKYIFHELMQKKKNNELLYLPNVVQSGLMIVIPTHRKSRLSKVGKFDPYFLNSDEGSQIWNVNSLSFQICCFNCWALTEFYFRFRVTELKKYIY